MRLNSLAQCAPRFALMLCAGIVTAWSVSAQNLTRIRDTAVYVGDTLRLRLATPQAVECTAPLRAIASDTLVVGAVARGCPSGTFTADVRMYRGQHAGRLKQTIGGAGAGMAVLGFVGYLLAECQHPGCERDPALVGLGDGIILGGLLGAGVGALLPTGPIWDTIGTRKSRTVRIAGLALNPGLRLAIATRRLTSP